MVRHCVFIRFQSSITDSEIEALLRGISDLAHLRGVQAIHVGDNVSTEVGMDHGYSRGFIIDFDSPASVEAYLVHPDHVAVGAKLVAAADGGADGIFVFDLQL